MLIDDLEFIEATSSEIQGGWRRHRRCRRPRFRHRLERPDFDRRGWGRGYNLHPLIHFNFNLSINIQIINININQEAIADNNSTINQLIVVDLNAINQ